ncbi:MAG: PLP-dependent transferase, partial [Ferruginibacter sp.]|nr:PLP-dependent transferase [Ferruginibacter sp.]
VSWGGHESLIIPKCAGFVASQFNPQHKEHRMLRLYVGLEEADYIIKDLEQGFEKMDE